MTDKNIDKELAVKLEEQVSRERESLCKDQKSYEIASRLMIMGNMIINERENEETLRGIMYIYSLLASELYLRLYAEEQVRLIEEKRDECNLEQSIENSDNNVDMVECKDTNDMFDKLDI